MKVKIEFEGKTTVPPAKLLRLAGGFWILDFFQGSWTAVQEWTVPQDFGF
jgi:hypothetical protein